MEKQQAEAQSLQNELEETRAALQDAEQRLSLQDETVQELQRKLDESTLAQQEASSHLELLSGQMEESMSQAESYKRLKDEYAEIEMEARKRASLIVEHAEQKAQEIRTQSEQESSASDTLRRERLGNLSMEYSEEAERIKHGMTAAVREVERVRQLLLDLTDAFEENIDAVQEMCGKENA